MRETAIRRARLLALGALALAGLASASSSAHAQGYYTITPLNYPGYCLDSNSAGQVYKHPCSAGNQYQQWQRWQGGWTKSRATGRCLNMDYDGNPVITLPCDQVNRQQYFQHWNGGWFQRMASTTMYAVCMWSHPFVTSVAGMRCSEDDPWNPSSRTVWFVRPV